MHNFHKIKLYDYISCLENALPYKFLYHCEDYSCGYLFLWSIITVVAYNLCMTLLRFCYDPLLWVIHGNMVSYYYKEAMRDTFDPLLSLSQGTIQTY